MSTSNDPSGESVTGAVTGSEFLIKLLIKLSDEEKSVSELAKELGVSRKTFYKWLNRALAMKLVRHGERRWELTEKGKQYVEREKVVSEITKSELLESVKQLIEVYMCSEERSPLPVDVERAIIDYVLTVFIIKTIQRVSEAVDVAVGFSMQKENVFADKKALNIIEEYWLDELRELAIYVAGAYYCSSDEAVKDFIQYFYWLVETAKFDIKRLDTYFTGSRKS
jgi:transposase-like protein